ncbi:MAG: restriction endonuclease subunit S [Opitutaceae bacterium]|nr:restriction endonuclease subunit S [Opitutaceae bacterium]
MSFSPLSELADVFTGITLRGESASKNDPNGTHRLIRISDISSDGVVGDGAPGRVRVDGKEVDRYTLRPGDVLVAARGSRLTAAVFDRPEQAVAGSQFLVIRVLPQHLGLSPGFLAWYLNLPAVQEQLAAQMRGSYIRSLPASVLTRLQVPVPDHRKQAAIVELTELQREENRLTRQISDRRAQIIQQLATNSIHFNPRSNVLG